MGVLVAILLDQTQNGPNSLIDLNSTNRMIRFNSSLSWQWTSQLV